MSWKVLVLVIIIINHTFTANFREPEPNHPEVGSYFTQFDILTFTGLSTVTRVQRLFRLLMTELVVETIALVNDIAGGICLFLLGERV